MIYGTHTTLCPVRQPQNQPRRFRLHTMAPHPNGCDSVYRYGCYFPLTDLCVWDMGERRTGEPQSVEWIDKAPTKGDLPHAG